ncbi:MAG: SEL1-like repeat protein [Succinivibrionaceae bacterium]|nr:SEL1-like repeat protein [Succinivibrionaceae bacterium]
MRLNQYLGFFLLALAAALKPASAEEVGERECLRFFDGSDYARAFVECSKAENLSISAKVPEALGFMYLYGRGVEKNAVRALELYLRAARAGSPSAAYVAGQIYGEGIGGASDPRLSDYYNHLAADKGYQPAVILEVARHYRLNPQDRSPAAVSDFEHLQAAGSSPDAVFLLAECFRTGYGTRPDPARALELYSRSSDPAAYLKTGLLHESRGDAQAARASYVRATENCVSCLGEAYYRLGMLSSDRSLLEKALIQGYHPAELELARQIISSGDKNQQTDWLKAEKYLQDACRRRIENSCILAAQVYFHHLPADNAKNADYLVSLMGAEDPGIYAFLGREYLRGGHLGINRELAFRFLATAWELNRLDEPALLAEIYQMRGDQKTFSAVCRRAVQESGDAECRALLAYDEFLRAGARPEALEALAQAFADGGRRAGLFLFTVHSRGSRDLAESSRALGYLEKAAQRGEIRAISRLFSRSLDAGHADKALSYASQALAEAPALGNLLLGRFYLKVEPRNFAKALEHLTLATNSGNADAAMELGLLYEKGLGADRDLFKACRLYQTAFEGGARRSSTHLSRCLTKIHDGDGRTLIPYIETAAADGDTEAIERLIGLYSDDESGTRNDRELVRWVTVGAKLGIRDCLYRLGDLYMQGLRDILDRDENLGRKYLNLAMEKGSSPAAWTLSSYYAQLGRHREACDIFEKFSGSQDYPFQVNLALCHINGRGRAHDPARGQGILLSAYAREQSSEVAYLLGQCYSDESSPVYDIEKALEWYIDAADLGDTGALFNLGALYEKNSPEFSLENAFHYYSKSMETGNMAAQLKVAEAYIAGRGVEKDPKRGCDLAEEAVNYSITDANPILARCYLSGQGREKSFDRAVALLHDGSDNNSTECSLMLADIYASGEHVDADLSFACRYYYQAALTAEGVEEFTRGADRFLPGKICHNQDERTYIVLNMLSRKLNTARYRQEILKIRSSLRDRERRSADELLKRYTDGND